MARYGIVLGVVLGLLMAQPIPATADVPLSVEIDGPSEVWCSSWWGFEQWFESPYGDVLWEWVWMPPSYSRFTAVPEYDLPGDIQAELDARTHRVRLLYSWDYDPACVDEPGGNTIDLYCPSGAGTYNTLSVTCTLVLVDLRDDSTSTLAEATDSVQYRVCDWVVTATIDRDPICAGAIDSDAHQTSIGVDLSNGFEPMPGQSVSVSLSGYTYCNTPPSVLPASGITDSNGHAEFILTSGDTASTVQVGACHGTAPPEDTDSVEIEVPSWAPDPEEPAATLVGDDEPLSGTLTQGDLPVPGHTIAWEIVAVYDENGDLVTDPDPGDYGSVTTSSVTDADGVAGATYSAGSETGYIVIQATDMTCYDTEEENPVLGTHSVIVTEIDHLEVSDAYQVGETDTWAAGVTIGERFVTMTAVMKPSISPEQAEGLIDWTGGEAVSGNPLQRRVSRQTTGTTTVTASAGSQSSHSVAIAVCEVTSVSIVSGAVSIDSDNAVVGADPEATDGAIVQVSLSPAISPVPEQLLLWMGGADVAGYPEQRQVHRTLPQKAELRCECGDSYDTYTVWVVAVDIGIAGVSEEDEDTTPGECYVNSDDDDGDSTEDLNDSSVTGENDLIAVSLVVKPEGVPAGTVTVTETARLALWETPNKGTAWGGSVDLSIDELPEILWVEGTSVSNSPGDQSVTMEYDFSSVHLEDEVLVTVLPRPGNSPGLDSSEAYLKLFRSYDAEDHVLSDELTGTIGGIVKPVLYITIGTGERIKTGTSSVTVRITDEYADYFDGTLVDMDIEVDLTTTEDWEVQTSPTTWADASVAPASADNKEGSAPIAYRFVGMDWNTMTQPLGNNGRHSLATLEQIEFEEWVVGDGWTNEYECGPAAYLALTENVCIDQATVATSNGTADYFKYDPEGGSALAHPHISFTIKDADPHDYYCIVRFRQTLGEGTWDWESGWSFIRYEPEHPYERTVDIDLTVPDGDGHCLNENDHEWGTYTFDVLALEQPTGVAPTLWTETEALDSSFMKRYRFGYYLWVPKDLPSPYGDKPGHDVWTETPENGNTQFRGHYCLESAWSSGQEAQVPRREDVCIVVVDPELNERGSRTGPSVPETLGADYGTVDSDQDDLLDGLLLYTVQDSDPAGTWRGIFTAADNGGLRSPEWRSHTPLRMMTANVETPGPRYVEYIAGSYAGTEWYGAWLRASGPNTSTIYLKPKKRVNQFVESEFNKHAGKTRTVAGINGGFFSGDAPVGYVGTGACHWVGNSERVRRWGFGITDNDWSSAPSTDVALDEPDPKKPGKYWRSPYVYAHSAGLSCVGCLIQDYWEKSKDQSADSGGVHWAVKDARTCIGWNTNGDIWLIVADGDDEKGRGWNWNDMCGFFTNALPPYMRDEFHRGVVISDAMALDGGGSTGFRYMHREARGGSTDDRHPKDSGRAVISGVLGTSQPR